MASAGCAGKVHPVSLIGGPVGADYVRVEVTEAQLTTRFS